MTVLTFSSEARVDAAWRDYVALCEAAEAEPGLKLDRTHVNAMIRAHDRYRRLFLAAEGGR